MKCLIIYFSLTGNTKKVAEAIYSGIKETGEQCDIAKIKETNIQDIPKYDLIGLGSPVHYFEPTNVRNFIRRMDGINGKHCFVFCTHATRPEAFFPSILEAFQSTGAVVIGTHDWYGSMFDPQIPKPYPTDGHPDEIDLKEAAEFGRQMIERSRRIHIGERELIPAFTIGREVGRQLAEQRLKECTDATKLFPPGVTPERWKQTQNFKLNAKLNMKKCRYPECTICIDNCPMKGIEFSASPARFAEPCMNCFYCEIICPRGAIEIDFREGVKVFRWRTEHVYERILARAEAEGSFRRLVPLEKVGWHTPFYKVYSMHPRYKIT